MDLDLKLHVEQLPDGRYRATTDEFPGLVAEGRTAVESIEVARDAVRRLFAQSDRSNIFASYVGTLGTFKSRQEIRAWLRDLREG